MIEHSATTGAGDEEVIIEDLRFAHEGVWRGICGKITLFSRAADALSASRDQLRAKDAEIERLRAELTEAHDDIKALCDERRAMRAYDDARAALKEQDQ